MADELKPCPFCGGLADYCDDGKVCCDSSRCPLDVMMYQHEWNTRPIEDAIRGKADAEILRLRWALEWIAAGASMTDLEMMDCAHGALLLSAETGKETTSMATEQQPTCENGHETSTSASEMSCHDGPNDGPTSEMQKHQQMFTSDGNSDQGEEE
jgi:hypothetical protein